MKSMLKTIYTWFQKVLTPEVIYTVLAVTTVVTVAAPTIGSSIMLSAVIKASIVFLIDNCLDLLTAQDPIDVKFGINAVVVNTALIAVFYSAAIGALSIPVTSCLAVSILLASIYSTSRHHVKCIFRKRLTKTIF